MNKFSIVTIYWGDDKPLLSFISDCKKWTDDVVVVYVNLHGNDFKSSDARIITVNHSYLLEHGYGETFNLGISKAKYDWTYIMGVGKEIVKINKRILNRLDSKEEAGFASVYFKKENETKWIKFSNRKRSSIVGKIHEEPLPFDGYYVSHNTFASWRYLKKKINDPFKAINEGYRAMSRLKWYYLYNNKIENDGPDSYKNSMKFLQKTWKKSGIDKINNLYKKYEYLYTLNRKDLCQELLYIDEWQDYKL
jgi:hypothetical protein